MSGYNPVNELVKKQYEEALLHGKYRDPKTVRAVWSNINLFENFTGYADFKTFNAEQAKSFKMWLEKQKNSKDGLLSISTTRSTLNSVREFFEWLAIHPQYVRKVDGRAVQYLRLSDNANRAARATRERTPPTLEELEKALKAMPHGTDIEKRDRAIFAFTIITCVRDDSLVSLKIKDVDAQQKKPSGKAPNMYGQSGVKASSRALWDKLCPLPKTSSWIGLNTRMRFYSLSQMPPCFPRHW